MVSEIESVLGQVGPRLRRLRQRRGLTLARLSERSGISESTLSRLESGQRRPTLQLLLPLAEAFAVPLDDLVGAPRTGDPRVHLKPVVHQGLTFIPLNRRAGGIHAFKMLIPSGRMPDKPEPRTHEGSEWLYVLEGRLRLLVAEGNVVVGPGEAAEFDTAQPHALGSADGNPVELLILFSQDGELAHLRPHS